MKKIIIPVLFASILAACGGGGGGGVSAPITGTVTPTTSQLAEICAVPRPAGTINPDTGAPYGDVQGTLTNEMSWIASYVNFTYLWYPDVPVVSSSGYTIGATVPYVDPTTNSASTETLNSNYDVVDAYFNSQRSPLFTASGKPKDQFHFTYTTADWQALSAAGTQAGFGFEIALIAATPPRQAVVSYTSPGSTAASAPNNIMRGAQIISVNGVNVANGTDVATLNEGLFSPVAGTSYTFVIQDEGSSTTRSVTMSAYTVTLTPVMNVGTLPSPNNTVGYILYNDQIATAESELIAAISQLKAANNGAGVTDLVLDMRYDGGGYLDLASELSYMIAGPAQTNGKIFEQDTYNNKNPFDQTTAETQIPFFNVAQGLSTAKGTPLPYLGLSTVYVITGSGTCSASEAIMNGLIGIGVKVVEIGATTCGKPYGFFPQDNCSTTYFTIQFEGVNNAGFGAYADGFIPGGTGTTANNLPGCAVADDFTKQLGDPTEGRLAATLQYRATGICPAAAVGTVAAAPQTHVGQAIARSQVRENRILRQVLQVH